MERLQHLFRLYLDSRLTPEEYEELWVLLSREAKDDSLREPLEELWDAPVTYRLSDERWQQGWRSLRAKRSGLQRRFFSGWRKIASVAAVFLLVIAGLWVIRFQRAGEQTPGVSGTASKAHTRIEAGKPGAMVYLESGKQILLDTAGNGPIQAGISKADGALLLDSKVAGWVTIQTPRGREQQLTLPDGTRLWLNAESSVRFMADFPGEERNLMLQGEAYFEVAKNKAKPFIVHAANTSIKVTGTQFNVMAYPEEPAIQTTLVEGGVEVNAASRRQLLRPGMQSRVAKNGTMQLVQHADIESAIAWKNGAQVFRKSGLKEIMRKIERWYDVTVVYETEVPDTESFTAVGLSRTITLEDMLKAFENSHIKFTIDEKNKRVVVQRK